MNKITKNIAALIAFGIGTTTISFAQVTQQKIGNNPTLINANAALEIESTAKGLLLPRLALTATNNFAPLAAHVAGMTVYNTGTSAATVLELNRVTPGYYYNDGSQWVRIGVGIEPWRQQATTNEATANNQNIYQQGKVAVGFTSADAVTSKQLEVKGTFKAEIPVAGGFTGTEVSTPLLNPNGSSHYWKNADLSIIRAASASNTAAALQAITGAVTNTFAATSTQSEMSSVNNTPSSLSLSSVRTMDSGEFRMESYNVASGFSSTFSLQGDAARLVHTNNGGTGDDFMSPNNRSEIMVQKATGVRFNFRNNLGTQTGEYWFPLNTGNTGQVMMQSGTGGKIVWTDPSVIAKEPWFNMATNVGATLNTDNIYQMGNVSIGKSTATSFTVGTTPNQQNINPRLHVEGDISTTGKVWTTNSVYADYVFEKYFKGSSDINPNYEFKSLNYVKDFIKSNHHLPGVESIVDLAKAENGYTFDMTKLTVQSLEKIEELYIHTIEQQDKIDQQQSEINKLKREAEETKDRLERLEKLILTK